MVKIAVSLSSLRRIRGINIKPVIRDRWFRAGALRRLIKIGLLSNILTIVSTGQISHANEIPELPSLGDASSATVSPEKEHRLGRAWLKMLRRQAPILYDPLINEYFEYLLYKIAEHSELQDHRIDQVIVNSPVLNAFAVPGGIIGVNAGLFIYARTEQEFASVLAHELAHLSQRHYSRGVEAAKRNQIPTLAALLATIVIAATVGGDAGMAAMASAQAAMLQGQLRFSRRNEQEADRIGIRTLIKSDMNPHAMVSMFERMLAAQRLQGSRPPEFLLTHPVTESRVADARNRASQYEIKKTTSSIEYHLMRNRIMLGFARSPGHAIKNLEGQLNHPDPVQAEAAQYGLALAYNKADRHQDAQTTISTLLKKRPNNINYIFSYAEINQQSAELATTEQLLRRHLNISPDNLPLSMQLAHNLALQKHYKSSIEILKALSQKHPENPKIWYELAEIFGLGGDILGVHQARAEYFILTGALDEAEKQLNYARKKAGNNYHLSAKLDQQLKDLRGYRNELKEL